jgi:pimeloyl-ACP methyl ester carboxylesterase
LGAAIETVLCIHSFSSSSRQYRSLAARLAPRFQVLAADLYGHGDRGAWQGAGRFTIAEEAAPFEKLLSDDVHLVAHSYGAAVALYLAGKHRARIRSMALYEPAIWGTLAALCPGDPATLEIETVRDDTIRLIEQGALEAAAARFIDYWAGAGAWAATAPERQPRLLGTIASLKDGWRAAFSEPWSAGRLRALDIPTLLMTGSRSTAAARRAIRLLRETLPRARVIEFDGLGHLGPITHPERVDDAVAAFLTQERQPWAQSHPSYTA